MQHYANEAASATVVGFLLFYIVLFYYGANYAITTLQELCKTSARLVRCSVILYYIILLHMGELLYHCYYVVNADTGTSGPSYFCVCYISLLFVRGETSFSGVRWFVDDACIAVYEWIPCLWVTVTARWLYQPASRSFVNPLKGRGVNWSPFAIQV